MIYDVLEQDFLKKTSRYKYNKTIKWIFIIADFIFLLYLIILILLVHFKILEGAFHPLWIGFLIWIILTYGTMTNYYPDYYYNKHKKETEENQQKKHLKKE